METQSNETTSQESTNTELNLVERAEKAAEEIRKANEEQKQLIERMEKAKAKEMLGGRSEAGNLAPEPKPETPAEYAKRIMNGELTYEKG